MTRWVVQLNVSPEASLDRLPGVAGRYEPGSLGDGNAMWDVVADVLPPLTDREVEAVDIVALAPVASAHVPLEGTRVKRTLLLRVKPETPPDVTASFERCLAAMPRHIPAIKSWALSRVDQRLRPSHWTHVWEQEYATIEGLRVDYMRSPYHWAGVDRWFDAEMPDAIVEDRLVHVFYMTDRSVL